MMTNNAKPKIENLFIWSITIIVGIIVSLLWKIDLHNFFITLGLEILITIQILIILTKLLGNERPIWLFIISLVWIEYAAIHITAAIFESFTIPLGSQVEYFGWTLHGGSIPQYPIINSLYWFAWVLAVSGLVILLILVIYAKVRW